MPVAAFDAETVAGATGACVISDLRALAGRVSLAEGGGFGLEQERAR